MDIGEEGRGERREVKHNVLSFE